MTSYLLDTHVVVWLATDPAQVPPRVRSQLEVADELLVSAASAYELAQKMRLGRLPQAEPLVVRWSELLTAMFAIDLPLDADDLLRAGLMSWEHRDPFDRMLVAQSQRRGLPLVTKDEVIQAFPGVTCLPWE